MPWSKKDFAFTPTASFPPTTGGFPWVRQWLRLRLLVNKKGYKVLRFWNNDVLLNTDAVLSGILSVLSDNSPLTPTLTPEGERDEGCESLPEEGRSRV
ncbi:MAG: DUF559 domain-containing protein [Deltaproteobacteria bacterium]|nr:DUF559 domain-containing protein [Deltaproteobacteria bacterium]